MEINKNIDNISYMDNEVLVSEITPEQIRRNKYNEYYQKNKSRILEKRRLRLLENTDRIIEVHRESQKKYIQKKIQEDPNFLLNLREKYKDSNKKAYIKFMEENPDKFKDKYNEYVQTFKENNPERYKEISKKACKKYKENNPEKYREINREACRRYRERKKAENNI